MARATLFIVGIIACVASIIMSYLQFKNMIGLAFPISFLVQFLACLIGAFGFGTINFLLPRSPEAGGLRAVLWIVLTIQIDYLVELFPGNRFPGELLSIFFAGTLSFLILAFFSVFGRSHRLKETRRRYKG